MVHIKSSGSSSGRDETKGFSMGQLGGLGAWLRWLQLAWVSSGRGDGLVAQAVAGEHRLSGLWLRGGIGALATAGVGGRGASRRAEAGASLPEGVWGSTHHLWTQEAPPIFLCSSEYWLSELQKQSVYFQGAKMKSLKAWLVQKEETTRGSTSAVILSYPYRIGIGTKYQLPDTVNISETLQQPWLESFPVYNFGKQGHSAHPSLIIFNGSIILKLITADVVCTVVEILGPDYFWISTQMKLFA